MKSPEGNGQPTKMGQPSQINKLNGMTGHQKEQQCKLEEQKTSRKTTIFELPLISLHFESHEKPTSLSEYRVMNVQHYLFEVSPADSKPILP